MKKLYKFLLPALLPVMALTACDDKEEIVFESQLPQFELRSDAVLYEVIMPQGTLAEEELYISGAFNGGDELAVGDPRWRLEPAENVDYKWGIYLFPSDFAEGKTPADGFHFVSAVNGAERTLKGLEVTHTDYAALGQRVNITVQRWQSYFEKEEDPGEIEHDGYAVFVDDQTGWDNLYLYQWGEVNDLGGSWPGATPTGTVDIKGVTYKYFDMGEANKGLGQNLIFNNGDGTQLADFGYTIDHDLYVRITADGCEEIDPDNAVTHDGYVVYVADITGWDKLYLYQWGEVNDLGGSWPGAEPTGTQVINGVTYKYFDMGEANAGLGQNLIFNNGDGTQLADFGYTIDHDVYLEVGKAVKEIDPATYVPDGGGDDPVPNPEPTVTYYLYVADNSGWDEMAVYAWGDSEVFGGWPGAVAEEAKKVNGKLYWRFPVTAEGANVNLIFNNNNGGVQFDGPNVTFDHDVYMTITATGAEIEEL